MKVTIVGKEVVSYFSKKKGQQVEGMSLYFNSPKEGVEGNFCDNIWIGKDAPLYQRMLGLKLANPLNVDVQYEMIPGSSYPQLIDIKTV